MPLSSGNRRILCTSLCLTGLIFCIGVFHLWNEHGLTLVPLSLTHSSHVGQDSMGWTQVDLGGEEVPVQPVHVEFDTQVFPEPGHRPVYLEFLAKRREQGVKMLYIAPDCDTEVDLETSSFPWSTDLSLVDINLIATSMECAELYRKQLHYAHIYVGDSGDASFLTEVAVDATLGGLLDLVVDEGMHTPKQQITSLQFLWHSINSGGVYFVGGLQTDPGLEYDAGDASPRDSGRLTTMKHIYHLLNDMMVGWDTDPTSEELESIECMPDLCVFKKEMWSPGELMH